MCTVSSSTLSQSERGWWATLVGPTRPPWVFSWGAAPQSRLGCPHSVGGFQTRPYGCPGSWGPAQRPEPRWRPFDRLRVSGGAPLTCRFASASPPGEAGPRRFTNRPYGTTALRQAQGERRARGDRSRRERVMCGAFREAERGPVAARCFGWRRSSRCSRRACPAGAGRGLQCPFPQEAHTAGYMGREPPSKPIRERRRSDRQLGQRAGSWSRPRCW